MCSKELSTLVIGNSRPPNRCRDGSKVAYVFLLDGAARRPDRNSVSEKCTGRRILVLRRLHDENPQSASFRSLVRSVLCLFAPFEVRHFLAPKA